VILFLTNVSGTGVCDLLGDWDTPTALYTIPNKDMLHFLEDLRLFLQKEIFT
jgi:hypothetical protein